MARIDDILEGTSIWTGYYRKHPDRFVRDYFHINLKLFQRILLVLMNLSSIFVYIASRGQGKTFLSAIFCACRATLYPGTKICIASGTRGQGINVLEKINLELVPRSPELAMEIDNKKSQLNGTEAKIVWKNGSYLKVTTASDSARGNRANLLLIDEFRMVRKDIIDTILRKFLTQRRMPDYIELSEKERQEEYNKEKNKTIYLSSAYFTDHWSYMKCVDTCKLMLNPLKHEFVCGLPYQLSISEGLLDAETIQDEMSETGFNEIKFSMEYEAIFYGNFGGSFFEFDSIAKNRKIKYPMLPARLSAKLKSDINIRIPPKQPGEKRILSADIALMATTKHDNDATAIHITQLIPSKTGRYVVNLVYSEINEGLRSDKQSLNIRSLYEEFDCDYIVLDTRNVGLAIYDNLAREMTDVDTGIIYGALSCCNLPELASRCVSKNAPKVIWAMNGNPTLNSECATLLREGMRSGRIRLLENEYEGEQSLASIKGYNSLSPEDKMEMQMPYINTTLLINEMVNLRHEERNDKIRVYEKSGMRKDRYSSLSYNYWVVNQLEKELNRRNVDKVIVAENTFNYRAPKGFRGKG